MRGRLAGNTASSVDATALIRLTVSRGVESSRCSASKEEAAPPSGVKGSDLGECLRGPVGPLERLEPDRTMGGVIVHTRPAPSRLGHDMYVGDCHHGTCSSCGGVLKKIGGLSNSSGEICGDHLRPSLEAFTASVYALFGAAGVLRLAND